MSPQERFESEMVKTLQMMNATLNEYLKYSQRLEKRIVELEEQVIDLKGAPF